MCKDLNLVHTDAQGNRMLIAQLDDEHLLNIIAMHIRKIVALRQASENENIVSRFDRALYNLQELNPEVAASQAAQRVSILMPYIMEAYLRELMDFVIPLRKALGRAEDFTLLPKYIEGE